MCILILVLVFFGCSINISLTQQYIGLDGAAEYLSKYGYANEGSATTHMSLSHIRESLVVFQKMMGLNPSGDLNEETMKMMNTPRCGNKDSKDQDEDYSHSNISISKYTLVGSKWERRQLKYRITQYSHQPRVSEQFIDRTIHQAFQLWAQQVDIEFHRTNNPAEVDIEIRFTEGNHGDRYPFPYGNGGQLAHAFYPGSGLGGDVHFNDAIDWTPKNRLLHTATHEIGHSLGLGHSDNQESIMFSHLIRLKENIDLHWDDISGIQQVYGGTRKPSTTLPPPQPRTTTFRPMIRTSTTPRTFPTTTTTPSTTTEHRRNGNSDGWDICADPRIDAITSLDNGDILVFKGEYVHTVRTVNGRLERQSPRLIKDVFNNRLPNNIDAALSRDTNKIFFLKGHLYWRANGLSIDTNYPKEISRHLPGVPDNLDAAMMCADNQLYFLKGTKFWKLNPRGRSRSSGVHQIEAHWKGIPNGDFDAAFRSPNGKTYFFKDWSYWRLNETSNDVAVGYPPYPRDTKKWWFSC